MRALLLALLLMLPAIEAAEANDFGRFRGRPHIGRFEQPIRVNVWHRTAGIRVWSFRSPSTSSGPSRCFPYGCGGIRGPFKNPDPDARKPENLTACMYDATGTLVYEREGKVCAYRWEDKNTLRVERRRQEWLRSQRGDSPR